MPRGGARPNSGPKKKAKNYGEEYKKGLLASLKRKARETGQDIHDIAAEMYYASGTQDAVRLGLLKYFSDVLVPKESHRTVEQTVTQRGPVLLPMLADNPGKMARDREAVPAVGEQH